MSDTTIPNCAFADGSDERRGPRARATRPDGMAYRTAVAQCDWQRLYIDREDLNADDWAEDYPEEVASREFAWGISGWKASLRRTSEPDDALVLVTLHGQVVEVRFEIPYHEAIRIYEDIEDAMAKCLSRTLVFGVQRTFDIATDDWSPESFIDMIDARWWYQAFTGLHVDVVNALIACGASNADLHRVAMRSGAARTRYLESFFAHNNAEGDRHWFERMAVVASPLAHLATPQEWIRLLAPGAAAV
jgi:hypothetical protein